MDLLVGSLGSFLKFTPDGHVSILICVGLELPVDKPDSFEVPGFASEEITAIVDARVVAAVGMPEDQRRPLPQRA